MPVRQIESLSSTTWHIFSLIDTLTCMMRLRILITMEFQTIQTLTRLTSHHLMILHFQKRICLPPKNVTEFVTGFWKSIWTATLDRHSPPVHVKNAIMTTFMRLLCPASSASTLGNPASSQVTHLLRVRALSASSAIWVLFVSTGTIS